MAIRLTKNEDNIVLSISTSKVEGNAESITTSSIRLDEEDVIDLIADLTIWLDVKTFLDDELDKLERQEKINDMNSKAMQDSYEQSQRKLKLENKLRDVFINTFDADYIEQQAIDAEINKIIKNLNKK